MSDIDILTFFNDDAFKLEYNVYLENNESKIEKFNIFLKSICIDKFEVNKSSIKPVKVDNISKDINGYLNKLSINNIDIISSNIKNKINDNHILYDKLLQDVLNKCVLQKNYCDNYLELIIHLCANTPLDLSKIISEFIDNYVLPTFEKSSEYDMLCENNKKLNILLGYSNLIASSTSKDIINNKDTITIFFNRLISTFENSTDNDEKYRCLQAIYIMMLEIFKKNDISDPYKTTLENILKNETTMKNKFKLMDIIERK